MEIKHFYRCAIAIVFALKLGFAEDGELPVYPELRTSEGKVYTDCKVKKVEVDALIFEHREGMARVSFFDLDESIRDEYDFDPVAAMEKYKRDKAVQRELKWKRFWEKQKAESDRAERMAQAEFLKVVKTTWMPIEASVLGRQSGGLFVRAKRIKFVPTKTRSTLGFEIDGPPRKTLVPVGGGVIFIDSTEVSGERWLGYLEPQPNGTVAHPEFPQSTVPRYRAVPRSQIP